MAYMNKHVGKGHFSSAPHSPGAVTENIKYLINGHVVVLTLHCAVIILYSITVLIVIADLINTIVYYYVIVCYEYTFCTITDRSSVVIYTSFEGAALH